MRLNEVKFDASPPIDAYGPGTFRIEGALWEGPLILSDAGPQAWAGWSDLAPLIALSERTDVVFLGMGAEIAPLDRSVRTSLEEAGLAFETMGTGPACRTYNVMLSEGRRIAAALIPA
ncbi:MAG: Mth938-like domain-containing protein [Pseudomonadota bacterium]